MYAFNYVDLHRGEYFNMKENTIIINVERINHIYRMYYIIPIEDAHTSSKIEKIQ